MSGHEEWNGSKPLKFRGGISTSAAPVTSSEEALGGGRKHFDERASEVKKQKLSLKRIEEPRAIERAAGTRQLGFKPTEPKPRPERKHVPAYDSMQAEPEFPRVQNRVRSKTGTLVQYTVTPEYDDHQRFMGRKTKVTTYEQTRNKLPVRSLGDKPYKQVQQSSSFYKGGGLIVGSTMIKRYPHQSKVGASDFATVISYDSLNPSRNKLSDVLKRRRLMEEQGDVKDLVAWERQTLKETVPGFREVSDSEEEH